MSQPPVPPPAPAPPPDGPPTIDFSLLLRGNWIGAAATAVAAFAVAGVLSLLTAFLGAENLDFKSAVSMTALLTGATFGADFTTDDDETLGQFPLLATMLALAAAVLVFRRVTARYPSFTTALGDVVRSGLILSLMTTALAIVVKIVEPDLRGYNLVVADDGQGPAWASFLIHEVGGEITTSMPGAIFLPFLLLVTVLVISGFLRRDWLGERLGIVYDWFAAPVAGVVAVILGLFVAGAVYLVAIIIHQDDARSLTAVVGMLSLLPSLGLRMLGLGSGAEFGWSSEFDGEEVEEMTRLSGFADDVGGLFWVAPILTVAIALFAVWAVIRRSPDRTKVMRDVAVYVGLLAVAVPFLARFANLTGTEGGGDEQSSFWLGIDGVQTTLFFMLISAVAGVLLLILSGSLDVEAIKARAQALQTNAGQTSQQWGQQPAAEQQAAAPPMPPPATGEPAAPPPPAELPPEEPPGWDEPPPRQ